MNLHYGLYSIPMNHPAKPKFILFNLIQLRCPSLESSYKLYRELSFLFFENRDMTVLSNPSKRCESPTDSQKTMMNMIF